MRVMDGCESGRGAVQINFRDVEGLSLSRDEMKDVKLVECGKRD
jgi:hypothetical protein